MLLSFEDCLSSSWSLYYAFMIYHLVYYICMIYAMHVCRIVVCFEHDPVHSMNIKFNKCFESFFILSLFQFCAVWKCLAMMIVMVRVSMLAVCPLARVPAIWRIFSADMEGTLIILGISKLDWLTWAIDTTRWSFALNVGASHEQEWPLKKKKKKVMNANV